jgi:hypothetical protein
MRRKLRTLTCLLLLILINSGFQPRRKLSEADVIRRAEDFVVQQGYTDLPPIADRSKWSPDSVWGKPDDVIMQSRRNSLEPRAYGVVRGAKWVVVFRMNPDHERYREVAPNYEGRVKKVGRAVTMDAYGGRIRMEHRDFNLGFAGLKKLAH